jgi:RNA polymerase sigma-70 factor (ECF subfamily)
MSTPAAFADFLRRVRAGDEAAAAELVRQYEPVIRREIRLRMTDTRLGRHFDSLDVCQSVLASLFLRVAAGQFELDHPEQLHGLLRRMARNKLAAHVKKERSRRRDTRRVVGGAVERIDPAAGGDTPSQYVAGQELLREFRRRLTPEEQQLAELRGEGREWAEIAARLGGTAEGRRKQLARALDRVTRELGLEAGDA